MGNNSGNQKKKHFTKLLSEHAATMGYHNGQRIKKVKSSQQPSQSQPKSGGAVAGAIKL